MLGIIHAKPTKLDQRSEIVAWVSGLVFAALLTTGCAVRLNGGAYDDTIDKGVTDVQQRAELYLVRLQSTPNTPFDQSFYDDINARLAVLKSRAASLPKYPLIVEELANLKSEFDSLRKLDKASPRPFPSAAVREAESAISVYVESILKLELMLRERGQATSPSLTKAGT